MPRRRRRYLGGAINAGVDAFLDERRRSIGERFQKRQQDASELNTFGAPAEEVERGRKLDFETPQAALDYRKESPGEQGPSEVPAEDRRAVKSYRTFADRMKKKSRPVSTGKPEQTTDDIRIRMGEIEKMAKDDFGQTDLDNLDEETRAEHEALKKEFHRRVNVKPEIKKPVELSPEERRKKRREALFKK